jgi:hypothetical protein
VDSGFGIKLRQSQEFFNVLAKLPVSTSRLMILGVVDSYKALALDSVPEVKP